MGLRDWISARRDRADEVPAHRRDRHVPPPPPAQPPRSQPPRPAPTHLKGPLDPDRAPEDLKRKWAEIRERKAQRQPPPSQQQQQQRQQERRRNPGRG